MHPSQAQLKKDVLHQKGENNQERHGIQELGDPVRKDEKESHDRL